MKITRCLWCCILFLLVNQVAAAQTCPKNVSFETGDLTGWECSAGSFAGGILSLAVSGPIPGRHTVLQNTSPQALDPYGGFPVNCPNGSNYSLQLGNSNNQHEAERVSYTYTIPADNQNFTLIYFYAVVLQDGGHTPDIQPKFQAALTDVTTGQLLPCGTHSFIPQNLTGFKKSPIASDVDYKEWSPVVINLVNCAGHTIRMDFTTNDCGRNAHFGYAYLDFNDVCDPTYAGPITGNKYCIDSKSVTLIAPPGFQDYKWYDDTHTTILSNSYTYTISPPPPDGTKYTLEVQPFPDLGCPATFTATIVKLDEAYLLKVKDKVTGCADKGVDLTSPDVTAGSSPMKYFQYFTDPSGQNFLSDPKLVLQSGTYYISGVNKFGCSDIKPVVVTLLPAPHITVNLPKPVCAPATVDITNVIAEHNDPKYQLGYFTDRACTIPLSNPSKIRVSETYYIKVIDITNATLCPDIEAIPVIVSEIPVIKPYSVDQCRPANITIGEVLQLNNSQNLTYTYWADAAATIPVDAANITNSGTYYIKGTNVYQCYNIAPVSVTVRDIPVFTVVNPLPVTYPLVVNLASVFIPGGSTNLQFSYWKDSLCTVPVPDYTNVFESGKYYIKGDNGLCVLIKSVKVSVNAPPVADLIADNTFTPNGDGINDLFSPVSQGVVKVNYLKIYNRSGQLVFDTKILFNKWDGNINGKPAPVGTYYWVFNCIDVYRNKEVIKSGHVTIIR